MHRMLVALLAVMLAVPALADDAVSLRLNWYMGGVHAPFFLGKERGFYRDAGLDLTINEGRGSANTAQVVAAGTDTFGLANSSSVMRLVSKDAAIRTVMSLLNTSSFGVISLAETNIQRPKDLEGKKLAITAGDALTQLFPAFAGFNKLDTSKIALVQIDPAGKVVALLEKRVDAILGGLDDQYFLVKQKGFNPAGMGFAKHGVNTVGLTNSDAGRDDHRQSRPGAPLRRRDAKVLGGGEGRSGRGNRSADEGQAGPRFRNRKRTSLSPTCRTLFRRRPRASRSAGPRHRTGRRPRRC